MKYCKKLFALLAAALLCMALTLPAGAAAPLVRDECGVFDADTLADLEEQAESASDGHDVDVYFLVVDDIGDADQRDYAKNYYISNGLGYGDEQSGILFLLAVGSRKYVTITYGEGVTAFTDYRIEQRGRTRSSRSSPMRNGRMPPIPISICATMHWTTMTTMASPSMWITTSAWKTCSLP